MVAVLALHEIGVDNLARWCDNSLVNQGVAVMSDQERMSRVAAARAAWESAQHEASVVRRLWGVSSPHRAREAQERADMAEAQFRRSVAM